MKEFLARARSTREEDLGPLAVELAAWVLTEAASAESSVEAHQKKRLVQLLGSADSQRLGLLLTDRVYRSAEPARTVDAALEALGLLGRAPELGFVDQLELATLRALGPLVPPLTSLALRGRLKRESEAFVLSEEQLGAGLARLHAAGRRVNLNQLGEEVLGERDADRYIRNTLTLFEAPDIDVLSVKLSSLYSQARVLAFEHVVKTVVAKLEPVFLAALRSDRLVYFDMEAYKDLELSREIFVRSVLAPAFLGTRAGLALQAYLPDCLDSLGAVLEAARERTTRGGRKLRVRLVKGANLAAETVQASLHRLAVPIYSDKTQVDANLKRALRAALRPEHATFLELGLGSHNVFDQAYAVLLAERRGVQAMLELEMLYGMAESIGTVWSQHERPVLVYAPAVAEGSFPAAIAYLVRRLDENTSRENFLASSLTMRAGDASFQRESARFLDSLGRSQEPTARTFRTQVRVFGGASTAAAPAATRAATSQDAASQDAPTGGRASGSARTGAWAPFDNAADSDWTRSWNRHELTRALAWAATDSFEVTGSIDGRPTSGTVQDGFDPSRPGERAYAIRLASAQDVERALETARRGLASWSERSCEERAVCLERCAEELETDRLRLIALMVKDAGKRVEEADIEVSEAIDFARYYARDLLRLGERYSLQPRGVTVVTPPWNFPLAIPLGGCLAALAAGNSVILKPAPETPLVAQAGVEALHRAGIPREALGFVPCADREAAPLIQDPRVAQVVLTGATATARLFLRMRPRLRLLAETGGKNAAYVSAMSDRELAIHAIVASAFGHAGQKCSALSVLVLEDEVYEDERFREALVDATRSLPVGSAWAPESFVTPLIRPPSGPLATVLRRGDGRARWALEPRVSAENPALVSPGILWGVPPGGFAHTTEFFGPVLSVLPARDLDHALMLMNGTPYGLTAGYFGLSESEQERFVNGMNAGNLYVNRSLTGAVVGRQPFGGRKDSCFGPGAKAGGPGYLAQFAHLVRRASDAAVGEDSLRAVLGTEVVGEANWLRYQPASVALVLGEDAADDDEKLTRRAAERVGAVLAVWREGAPRNGSRSQPDLAAFFAETGLRRVRLLGRAPPELGRLIGTWGLTVLDDPVSTDGDLEARHYLLEQSVSLAHHRYGNVSLAALHPLIRRLGGHPEPAARH